jgi:hypothetical protein
MARLHTISSHEHIRRIEHPAYKRRWDEQWRIGNAWQCGPAAYDAELLEAFAWWLAEKAEWWLEQRGASAALTEWAEALWADPRVQAAWPVAAEAAQRLPSARRPSADKPQRNPRAQSASPAAFARYFTELVKSQSAPDSLTWAVPWEHFTAGGVTAAVKALRGKLNVPRERFWKSAEGLYRVAVPLPIKPGRHAR